jgi:flagellar hook protein FlgE
MSIPLGTLQVKEATTKVTVEGNLSPNDLKTGDSISTAFDVFDGKGNIVRVRITAMLSSVSETLAVWDVIFARNQDSSLLGSEIYVFNTDGSLEIDPQLMITVGDDASSPPIHIDFRLVRGNRSLASEIAVSAEDGAPVGTLEDYAIEGLGIISGFFSNGLVRNLGRLVVALIRNPETLIPESAGVFSLGPETAEPFITTPSNL